MQKLEELKMKPDHVKRRFAFLTSLGITVVIFMFWVASFGVQSSSLADNSKTKVETPFSAMTASVGDAFDSLGETIANFFTGTKKITPSNDAIELIPAKKK